MRSNTAKLAFEIFVIEVFLGGNHLLAAILSAQLGKCDQDGLTILVRTAFQFITTKIHLNMSCVKYACTLWLAPIEDVSASRLEISEHSTRNKFCLGNQSCNPFIQ